MVHRIQAAQLTELHEHNCRRGPATSRSTETWGIVSDVQLMQARNTALAHTKQKGQSDEQSRGPGPAIRRPSEAWDIVSDGATNITSTA